MVGDGQLAADIAGLASDTPSLRVRGRFAGGNDDALLSACRRRHVDAVVFAVPPEAASEVQRAAELLAACDVGLLHGTDGDALRALTGEAGRPLLAPTGLTPGQRATKSVFDRMTAATALLLLLPLLVFIAMAVRLTSPGPAVFRQRRMGEGGRPFANLKFRTMRWSPGGQDGRVQASPGDRG